MFRHTSRAFQTVPLVSSGTTLKIRTLVDAAEALLLQWPADNGSGEALVAAANEAGMRVIERHL
jgi:hypothetical protein